MCTEFKPLRRACEQESDDNENKSNLKLFIKYVCNVSQLHIIVGLGPACT